jgi:protein gp37
MGLIKTKGDNSKSNMYHWITARWNPVKGECPHQCSYCYTKRWGKQPAVHFDERELKTDLQSGHFIFVCSGCDLFADAIPNDWIINTLTKMNWYDNHYLLQSKNPGRMASYLADDWIDPRKIVLCTTIESNKWEPTFMGNAPTPSHRANAMACLGDFRRFVTIEPIMDFDLAPLVELVQRCEPEQVNIGADSGGNGLPEPPAAKVLELEDELRKFTKVERKKNLARILGKA